MNEDIKSYNFSHYSLPKQEKLEKIINCLVKHPEGLQPKQIALKTRLNKSTVKAYLKILFNEGYVKTASGWYYPDIKPTHSVEKPIKIHNINLLINNFESEKKYEDKSVEIGNVKILVRFGQKNKRITGVISGEPPLNYREFCFAVEKFKSIIYSVIGSYPLSEDITISSCEFNTDYDMLRLEGLKAVTLTTFEGNLLKIYDKQDKVRFEARAKLLSLPAVASFLKEGAPYNLVEGQAVLKEEVRELKTVVRYLNEQFFKNQLILSAILDRLSKTSSNEIVTKETISYKIERGIENNLNANQFLTTKNLKEELK